jgi:mRNA interferase RelE/StbE
VPTATARKSMSRLPAKAAIAIFEFVDGPLRRNPHRLGKELRGELAGLWSARRGDYRVIYRLDEDQHTVYLVFVSHRRDAYRP